MTGIVTDSWIALTTLGFAIRATPPSARMSAGTRSSAITDTAPASSAIRACSAVVTSMITPPFSISASPRLTRNVARSGIAPIYGCSLGWAGRRRIERRLKHPYGDKLDARRSGPGPRLPHLLFRAGAAARALLQLERADPVLVGALVAGVHPVRKR